MNTACYFLGGSLIVLAGTIWFSVSAVTSKIDDVKDLAAKAPVLIEDVRRLKKEVDATADRITASAEKLKVALPTLPAAGTKLGEAGANVLKGFADKVSGRAADPAGPANN